MSSIYFSSWLAFVLRRGEAAVLAVTVRKAELKQREGRAAALGTGSQLKGLQLRGGWEHFCCGREEEEGGQCEAKRLSGEQAWLAARRQARPVQAGAPRQLRRGAGEAESRSTKGKGSRTLTQSASRFRLPGV